MLSVRRFRARGPIPRGSCLLIIRYHANVMLAGLPARSGPRFAGDFLAGARLCQLASSGASASPVRLRVAFGIVLGFWCVVLFYRGRVAHLVGVLVPR